PHQRINAGVQQMYAGIALSCQSPGKRRQVDRRVGVHGTHSRSKSAIDEDRRIFGFAFQIVLELLRILKIDGVPDMAQVEELLFRFIFELVYGAHIGHHQIGGMVDQMNRLPHTRQLVARGAMIHSLRIGEAEEKLSRKVSKPLKSTATFLNPAAVSLAAAFIALEVYRS